MKGVVAFSMVAVVLGCSSSNDGREAVGGAGKSGGGGRAGGGGVSGNAGAAPAGSSGTGAGRAGAGSGATAGTLGEGGGGGASGEAGGETSGGEAGEGSAGEGGMPSEFVPLPAGSRERAGVVNLVDAAAAAALAGFLDDAGATGEASVVPGLNLFLEHYLEEYDFVYLVTDHRLDSSVAGRFFTVNREAMPGLGYGMEFDSEPIGIKTSGRTRGVIGVQYEYRPYAHELFHYWGTHYGAPFGFGLGDEAYGPHWGYVGLKGVHGGFDAATLRCSVPEGALPPNCTAETNGRIRYWVDLFFPNDNGIVTPFSPLELYMLGVAPLSEVPESFIYLTEATALYDTFVEETNALVVEASGITTLTRDEFVETYGRARRLDEEESAFSAAFVVVSATPAADSVLDDVGEWAAVIGNRRRDPGMLSFEELTGGRATLDTELGPRRREDVPAPPAWDAEPCDIYEQDCGDGRACFFSRERNVCGLSRGGLRDEPCDGYSDCAPGLGCVGTSGTDAKFCEPYCSADDSEENACSSLCPWFGLADEDGVIVAGICQPP